MIHGPLVFSVVLVRFRSKGYLQCCICSCSSGFSCAGPVFCFKDYLIHVSCYVIAGAVFCYKDYLILGSIIAGPVFCYKDYLILGSVIAGPQFC